MRDVPITVDLPGTLGAEVRAWAEGEAGWQVVEDDGPLRPVLRLSARPRRGVVVVAAGTPGSDLVRNALRVGALDVIAWPGERERLRAAARAAVRHLAEGGDGDRRTAVVVRVGALAGGAGASTVALAVGGLAAWAARPTLVVGGDDLTVLAGLGPWHGPGATDLAVLGPAEMEAELPRLRRPVPCLPALAVLGGVDDPSALPAAHLRRWPVPLVVVDVRTATDAADLLVGAPDAGLLRSRGHDVPVVINGSGPLGDGAVTRALERPPAGWLPASRRVAQAGARGRVPGGLPGTWLRALRPVVAELRTGRGQP